MKVVVVFAVFLVCQTFAYQISYDQYRVYRLVPRTTEAVKALQKIEENGSEIQFWTSPVGVNASIDIMIPPYHTMRIENLIKYHEIDAVLLTGNVQTLIDNENKNHKRNLGFGWTDYHTLEEINDWLASLEQTYPDKVKLIKVGSTYEGRDILGVHVTFKSGNENNAIFIEANIHAREWITAATATYILNELLTSTDPDVRSLADTHDWYVVPVFNPDGYAYTHSTDRLWRKTRVPYGLCYGADPNRNWGYHWNEGGTSNNPCSDTYRGPSAFSEPSTKSIADFITTIGTKLVGYVAFHSYSQLLLIPYGYSSDHLDNFDQLNEIGLKAAETLAQRYGTDYTVGNIVETIYIASGGSMDWVKGTFKTPVTYTYELRDTGRYGFILPAEQIIPTGEETLDSIVRMFQEYDKQK